MKPGSDANRDLLRQALATPASQRDLAKRTKLPERTISNLLRGMADRNEVHVAAETKGRQPRVWAAGPHPMLDDDSCDAEAEAKDLAAARAWVKGWAPRRCPLVAVFFGPAAMATTEN